MAAKGTATKQLIMKKLLEIFPDSFLYNGGKELRINQMEDGELVQIKLTLTASKNIVENEDSLHSVSSSTASINNDINFEEKEEAPQEPSEEEKERLKILLEKMGIA